MRNYKAQNVDEYIANAEPEARQTLEEIRELIRSTVPDAEETISWGIPFYKYHGMLAGFSVFTNHVSFGMGGPELDDETQELLGEKGYKTGKKIIQIRFEQEVPRAVIREILKSQAKENETKNIK